MQRVYISFTFGMVKKAQRNMEIEFEAQTTSEVFTR